MYSRNLKGQKQPLTVTPHSTLKKTILLYTLSFHGQKLDYTIAL
jgi:hypothetical protein